MDIKYKISIIGIAEDHDITEVSEKFANLFKIDEKKALNILFKRYNIKNELDKTTAYRYKDTLENIGVMCSIESLEPDNIIANEKQSALNIDLKKSQYSEVYNTIDRYYKSKNDMFKFSIGVVCHSKDDILTEDIIQYEIDRLSSLANQDIDLDEGFDEDDKLQILSMSRFYEDIIKFKDYFHTKGINLTVNDILCASKEVQQRNVNEESDEHSTNLFEKIKSMLDDEPTETDIIKQYIFYNIEQNNEDILHLRCMIDLPDLLSRFGYEYHEFTEELQDKYNFTLKVLQSGHFESCIESSYDEINAENCQKDTRIENKNRRNCILSSVKREVWRRDNGICSKCGSRENLEYDHIIPVSKGGSNTARNIELLCQDCNRKKSNKII